jgi:hypothetical protein
MKKMQLTVYVIWRMGDDDIGALLDESEVHSPIIFISFPSFRTRIFEPISNTFRHALGVGFICYLVLGLVST